jgi:hypothetical protein
MDFAPLLYPAVGLLIVLVLIDTAVILGTVSALGRLSRAFQASLDQAGPAGDTTAPSFSAIDVDGNRIDNEALSNRMTALLFVSTTCNSCIATLTEMQALKHRARDGIVVVCQASQAACKALLEPIGVQVRIIADEAGDLTRLFAVTSVPFAVVLESGTQVKSRGYPLRQRLDDLAGEAAGTGVSND